MMSGIQYPSDFTISSDMYTNVLKYIWTTLVFSPYEQKNHINVIMSEIEYLSDFTRSSDMYTVLQLV